MAARFAVGLLGVVVLVGCGLPEPEHQAPALLAPTHASGLTGDVTVHLAWEGTFAPADQARVAALVAGLEPAGYLKGLGPRGLAPHFVLTDVEAQALVRVVLRGQDVAPLGSGEVAFHAFSGTPRHVDIVINPLGTDSWQATIYSLAHELVEAVANPWLELPDGEVADACQWNEPTQLTVGEVVFNAPKYASALAAGACQCWPCGQ